MRVLVRAPLLAAAVLVLTIAGGCSKTVPQDYIGGVSFVQHITPAEQRGEGAAAPEFSWFDSTGKTVSFKAATQGKAVLLNFWATWCGPCKEELPQLKKIERKYAPKGVVVIGVVSHDWRSSSSLMLDLVHKFTLDWRMHYPIVIESKQTDSLPLWDAFGLKSGLPTSVLIDRQGRIVKTLVGTQTEEKFSAEIDKLL